ncbi:MAG: DUF1045 domain-containing protein [Roseovarius sp.]
MPASDTSYHRYAVYFVPSGDALARFGAHWLGWDINGGKVVAYLDVADLPAPIEDITATPRRYGLHATIVPPFHLAHGITLAHLKDVLERACSMQAPVHLDALALARLGRFLALVPVGSTNALNTLAADMLHQLDTLRAPPSTTDLERHRTKGLTPAQDALLQRWGYPYVMEAFKCHLTLTGKLPKAQARTLEQQLGPLVAQVLPRPFVIGQLALVGQDAQGWFHVVHQYDLTGLPPV